MVSCSTKLPSLGGLSVELATSTEEGAAENQAMATAAVGLAVGLALVGPPVGRGAHKKWWCSRHQIVL